MWERMTPEQREAIAPAFRCRHESAARGPDRWREAPHARKAAAPARTRSAKRRREWKGGAPKGDPRLRRASTYERHRC